ncbi:MAG: DnaJ domain-containing protein [Kofleriaceae bacterium]
MRISQMAAGQLSIKLRCASWQQLATIYKRDLSRGTMFLKASTPPPIGTLVQIDLMLPSGSVVVLTGAVAQHVSDAQRGAGVEIKLAPIPTGTTWMIESALQSEVTRTAAAQPASMSSTGPIAIAGDDVGAAEQELVQALISEAESLKKLNPFLVLGIGYEASDADVRAAFGELTKRYHPDRFARYESSQLRQVAAEIFILIRDAYRKLSDETGRAQTIATIAKPSAQRGPAARVAGAAVSAPTPSGPPGPPPPPMPSANVVAKTKPRGDETPRLVRSDPQAQIPTVRRPPDPPAPPPPLETDRRPMVAAPPPVLADSSDSGRIDQLLETGKFDEALAAYKVMSKKHPQDRSLRAGIELCEGLRALAARDRLEAAQRFEAALEIDPSNEHAARELADLRRQATNERKGLLSRLMGKDS